MTDIYTATAAIQSLLAGPQTNRLLRLSFPRNDGPKAFMLANRLDASEGLSRDFSFQVEVLSNDGRLALKDVQGKMVTVELVREDGSLRYFNGYVFEFRLIKTDGGHVYYSMQLGPWMQYLRLRRNYHLFHGKNIQQQTTDIFAAYPMRDWQSRIGGEDADFTDACQAGETDYNYLQRRWEQRGWHYWYEHRADGHTLMLGDDSTRAEPIDGAVPAIAFQREAGAMEDDAIGEWSPVRRIVPGKVALTSFDFKKPHPQAAELHTINQQGDVLRLEVYDYAGAYGFTAGDDGAAQVRRGMEEIEASGKHFDAAGNDRGAQPGRWFRLTGHFDIDSDDSSKDGEFLILDVRHSAGNNYQTGGAEPAHYSNRLTCIRKTIPWRPGRGFNSVEPKIHGLQTAIVVGPAGEEIHTDLYGRVRVKFHWDRVGQYDEKCSAWVRVATPWAGSNFGMTSIPRVGTEVIVQFLDGNPDRPLITGMVPNAETMPPWALPANKTQSGILSRSTPGGSYANANALRFEDKKGQEQLWLHAEKDQLTEVEHDEDKWVGHDRRKTVDHDETNHIKHDRIETVDHNEDITVHNDRTEVVDRNETITVHNDRTERVDRNEKISIGNNRDEDVGRNETVAIGGNRRVTVGGHKSEKVSKTKTETITLAKMLTVGGLFQTTVGGAMNSTVGLMHSEQVGLSSSQTVGMDKSVDVGGEYTVKVGKKLTIEVGKTIIVMNADGSIAITGESINITAQGGDTTINGQKVWINPVGGTAAAQPSGGGDKKAAS